MRFRHFICVRVRVCVFVRECVRVSVCVRAYMWCVTIESHYSPQDSDISLLWIKVVTGHYNPISRLMVPILISLYRPDARLWNIIL